MPRFTPKIIAAAVATALALLVSPVLPASSSALPAYESRLSVVFSKSETGTGQSRTITYTAVVTDTLGQLVGPSAVRTGQQIQVAGMNVDTCQAEPLPRVAGWTMPDSCETINVPTSDTGSGSTLTITEVYTGQNLIDFEANLVNYPIEVPLVGFTGPSGERMLILSSSRSLGASQTDNATAPENDPGVSYAGPIVARLERNIVGGTGSITIHGKRLSTLTSVTIGGIAVELTTNKAGRTAVVVFSELPSGSHDLVITAKGGKTTIRGAVKVN